MRDGIYRRIVNNILKEEQYEQRIKICHDCPSLENKSKNNGEFKDYLPEKCGECGCFIAIKARLKHFDCPLGKW